LSVCVTLLCEREFEAETTINDLMLSYIVDNLNQTLKIMIHDTSIERCIDSRLSGQFSLCAAIKVW